MSALPCDTVDPDLFFSDDPGEIERAKALCAGCPRKAACAEGALERREPFGIFGGLDPIERGTPYKPETAAERRADRHATILALAAEDPEASTRDLARRAGVSQWQVLSVMGRLATAV